MFIDNFAAVIKVLVRATLKADSSPVFQNAVVKLF
jgi:hypothetical protein